MGMPVMFVIVVLSAAAITSRADDQSPADVLSGVLSSLGSWGRTARGTAELLERLATLAEFDFSRSEPALLEEYTKLLVDVLQKVSTNHIAMETSHDFVLDCIATITRLAKAVAKAWPEGSSLRMRQEDSDVVLSNKDGKLRAGDPLVVASSSNEFAREVVTPPIVLVGSQSGDFLGYSAEFESKVDREYSQFPSDMTVNFNVTSVLKAAHVSKHFTLRHAIPLDLASDRNLVVSRLEEAITRNGGNVTIASASSTTQCDTNGVVDTRLATDKLNGCTIKRSNGRDSSCDCSHANDVTVYIKVWQLGMSGVLRWSIASSSVVSFIAITITMAILGYVRCLWKRDKDLFRTMALVAIAITDVCLALSVQIIENEIFCKVNAIILHFSYLSICAWMLVRGSLLLRQSHAPLHAATESLPKRRIGLAIGLCVPLVTVAISATTSMSQYATDFGCLASFMTLLWTFLLPAIVIASLVICTVSVAATCALTNAVPAQSTSEAKHDLQQFAPTAVLAVAMVLLMPPSLAAPAGKVTAIEWLFVVVNSLLGPCALALSCFMDAEVRKDIARRVGQNKPCTDNLEDSEQKHSSLAGGIHRDRLASYMDVEFTPVILGPGANNHRLESTLNSADNDGFRDCPEINLRTISCAAPTPYATQRQDSSVLEMDYDLIPGMVTMDGPNLVKEVQTTHRVLVRGAWHVEEEKVVRKVYQRPRSNRETSTV